MQIERIKFIKKINNESKKYDIEVKDTHVYFANNILVHNCNFQITINSDGEINFGKRSSFIGDNEEFYNHKEALNEIKVQKFINDMQIVCKSDKRNIIFYGELFGGNIQKEVYYGKEKLIRFYDIFDVDIQKYLPATYAFNLFKRYNVNVPIIAEDVSFDVALAWKNDFISTLTPITYKDFDKNICEGIVIKPQYEVIMNSFDGEYFVIKSKNAKFKENSKKSNKKNIKSSVNYFDELKEKGVSDEVINLAKTAINYVNENRLNNVISHEGPLTIPKQISEYMKYFMEDYQNDLIKDNKEIFDNLKITYNSNDLKNIEKIIFSQANNECIKLIKNHIFNRKVE